MVTPTSSAPLHLHTTHLRNCVVPSSLNPSPALRPRMTGVASPQDACGNGRQGRSTSAHRRPTMSTNSQQTTPQILAVVGKRNHSIGLSRKPRSSWDAWGVYLIN